MLLNSAKANFTLGELGWTIYPPGNMNEWDGLTNWFLRQIEKSAEVLQDPYLRRWHTAANSVLGPNNGEPSVASVSQFARQQAGYQCRLEWLSPP